MQSSKVAVGTTHEDKPEKSPHNGWLGYVGGQHNAAGISGLPTAGPSVESPRIVEMDVPSLGRVRIRYETWSYRHRKTILWAWRATWCDKVGE
jgi:hypothetical protein